LAKDVGEELQLLERREGYGDERNGGIAQGDLDRSSFSDSGAISTTDNA